MAYLLFLKMAQEQGGKVEAQTPKGQRWAELNALDGTEQLAFYGAQLLHLGTEAKSPRVKAIFADAQTSIAGGNAWSGSGAAHRFETKVADDPDGVAAHSGAHLNSLLLGASSFRR